MDGIKHSRRFAELEALMGSYFRHHFVPVMTQTQSYLTEKQGEEMKAYSTSLGGILGMMASAGQPLATRTRPSRLRENGTPRQPRTTSKCARTGSSRRRRCSTTSPTWPDSGAMPS